MVSLKKSFWVFQIDISGIFVYFTLDACYKVKSHFIILLIRRVKSFFLSEGTQISYTFAQDAFYGGTRNKLYITVILVTLL